MQQLSLNDNINLPIMSHPTFSGSNLISDRHGFSYYCFLGQLQRLSGADASIHASYLGRFAFTKEQCIEVNAGCSEPLGNLKPIFPTPGGGMSIDTTSQLHDFYGIEVIFLVGGGLHKHSPDLVENARHFLKMVKQV
jgi:ribulose-bisphosphate carboxylase large chain